MSIRTFLGLGPPPKVQKKTNEDELLSKKLYDQTKRKRTIVPSWKTEFKEWLLCDDSGQTIYCSICRACYGKYSTQNASDKYKKYGKSPFVTGSTNLKHDSLVSHQNSAGHAYAVSLKAAKEAKTGSSQAEKAVEALNHQNFNRLSILFRNVHALAKHSRPMSDFIWFCEADDKKGLDIGPTYRNSMSAKQFLVAISEVEHQNIERDIQDSKFLTIMSDGSTDVSVMEQEIVYIHLAKHGVSKCFFISIQPCETANSVGIYQAILSALRFASLCADDVTSKMIAFAGDGASVNTGHLNGVIAHFKNNIDPAIIMVKCMGHRVELLFKDVMKQASMFKVLYDVMDQLFKFYHKSPKQMSCLKRAFSATGIKPALPIRIGGTRWMAHTQRALKNILTGYEAYLLHLSEVSIQPSQSAIQPKAKYLVGRLKSKDLINFAHFVLDLLAVLVKLSLSLQERCASVYRVHQDLIATATVVKKLASRHGPEQRHFEEVMHETCDKFGGQELSGELKQSPSQIARILVAVEEVIQQRFCDLSDGVLEATKMADFTSWPPTYEEAADFGDEYVAVIVDHYRNKLLSAGVTIGLIDTEWTLLKQDIYENQTGRVGSLTWEGVNKMFRGKYDNVLDVFDLLLALPSSTAECERGFSQMKITKTQYRNKLRTDTMTMLMTVQLHSAAVSQYDPTAAIHQWNSNHRRRPDFLAKRHRKEQIAAHEDLALDALVDTPEPVQSVSTGNSVCKSKSSPESDYESDSDFSDLDDNGSDDDSQNVEDSDQ